MALNFDDDALMKMVRASDGFRQLQADANGRIRAVVRDVNSTHANQPVDVVDAELRRRFSEAGITPEEPGFGDLVQAMSRGEVTG